MGRHSALRSCLRTSPLLVVAAVALLSLSVALAYSATALAGSADWIQAPFPEGATPGAVVQDSAGNLWATILTPDWTTGGHVDLLPKDWQSRTTETDLISGSVGGWMDACEPGLDWETSPWSNGLVAAGDKVFLVTNDGLLFSRTAVSDGWHQISTPYPVAPLTLWAGSLWTGTDVSGVARLDPSTEQVEMANDGLIIVVDNLSMARTYSNPRGNSRYLYVGSMVTADAATQAGFPGVTVYRLARGGTTWEDTGLNQKALPGDVDTGAGSAGQLWGAKYVVPTDGYVVCEVSSLSTPRYFLFSETGGTWTGFSLPDTSSQRYRLNTGEPCFALNGKFYFPTGFGPATVICDVLDPATLTWSRGVTVKGTGWPALGNTVQLWGNGVLVHSDTPVTGGGATTGEAEHSFTESVPLPSEISTDPGVIGTNLGLAFLFAIVFGFTSVLFNNTVRANHAAFMRALAPFQRGARAIGRASGPAFRRTANSLRASTFRYAPVRAVAFHAPRGGKRWLEPLVVMLLAALIYAFLDPTFGVSKQGTSLFFSLFISVAAVTLAYEGVQAVVSSRGFKIPAALKLFPAALVIAVLCVILSRVSGFHPGYLYGFVGGLAFLGHHPEENKRGRIVLAGAVCLLVVSVGAWFLAMPLAKSADAGHWWASFLETACEATFVAGLEGLLFGLIPLRFIEGGAVFYWSKVVWSVMFGIALFMFWHVLLNKSSKYGAAFEETNTQVILGILGFWTVITVGTWAFFRARQAGHEPARTQPPAPYPILQPPSGAAPPPPPPPMPPPWQR